MVKKLILKKSLLVAGILYIPGVRSTLHGSSGKGPIHCSGLAGIPTAGDVTQEGIRPGEMSRLLMQKIEELTLYVIDLKNTNHDLVKRLQELEKKSKRR